MERPYWVRRLAHWMFGCDLVAVFAGVSMCQHCGQVWVPDSSGVMVKAELRRKGSGSSQ